MNRLFTLCVMIIVIITTPGKAISQTPLYKFNSYTLDSGTSNSVGAVYRFANVFTNVDALIKVIGISSGMTLRDIDRTADGYSEAFQPEYKISGVTNGYIDFKITFVTHATSTVVSQPNVSASGLDIDGSSSGSTLLKEYNKIDMGGGTYEYNTYNTQLIIAQSGTAYTATNTTGILFGALVDTAAKEVMYTVSSTNVSSLTYRVGANNQMTGSSNRYASLYFNKFVYQHFPLAISNLLSFNGSAIDKKVNLQWEIGANKYTKVVLEKSNNSSDFNKVSEYVVDVIDGGTKRFSYTDNSISDNVIFYRLKSTSESGHVEYSNILSFRFNTEKDTRLNVFPTIVQSVATVNIAVTEKTTGLLQVTDFSGRTVKQQQLTLNTGSNNITINGFERFLKGNYVVSVRTVTGVLARQIVVQ